MIKNNISNNESNNSENITPFISASEARKEWSQLIDDVVREKPQFIKRTRDNILISDFNLMSEVLKAYQFTATKYVEDDNTITLSLNEIDLIENGASEQDARLKLAKEILEYSKEYYDNFQLWSAAPNRRSHIPYVLKALILQDTKVIGESITWQHGRN